MAQEDTLNATIGRIVEADSSNDVDSESADATKPAGGDAASKNRPADKKTKVPAPKTNPVKTPQGMNDTGMKESLEALSAILDEEGAGGLSDEFKSKIAAVFEVAVKTRAEEAAAAIVERELETATEGVAEDVERARRENSRSIDGATEDVARAVQEEIEGIQEKLDKYLDYVVEQWMKANEVEIESTIKVEIAESLMDSLRDVVTGHNMKVAEADENIVEDLEKRLRETDDKYNQAVEEVVRLREEKEKVELDFSFHAVAEGLTDTEADKLKTLAEGLSYKSIEEFETKLLTVREQYFDTRPRTPEDRQMLEEAADVEDPPARRHADPTMSQYMDAIDRHNRATRA